MPCPRNATCVFHQSVEPSIIKRVKYASVYSYCRGGSHDECAVYAKLVNNLPVPRNLMPDGSTGDYADDGVGAVQRRFLVIEDTPVFAALASSTIAEHYKGAEIVRRTSFETAMHDLMRSDFSAVICGFGLGENRTAHDVRRLTHAPMVVLTGRPGHLDLPERSRIVPKGAGPEALAAALRASIA